MKPLLRPSALVFVLLLGAESARAESPQAEAEFRVKLILQECSNPKVTGGRTMTGDELARAGACLRKEELGSWVFLADSLDRCSWIDFCLNRPKDIPRRLRSKMEYKRVMEVLYALSAPLQPDDMADVDRLARDPLLSASERGRIAAMPAGLAQGYWWKKLSELDRPLTDAELRQLETVQNDPLLEPQRRDALAAARKTQAERLAHSKAPRPALDELRGLPGRPARDGEPPDRAASGGGEPDAASRPALPPGGFVADTGTKIKEALVQYNGGSEAMILDFMRKREKGMSLLVMVAGEADRLKLQEKMKAERLDPAGIRFLPCTDNKEKCEYISQWSRDHSVLAANGGGNFLFQPAELHKYFGAEGKTIGDHFRDAARKLLGGGVVTLPVTFEGGDLLTTPRHLLAPQYLLYRNPQLGKEGVAKILESASGKPIEFLPYIPGWPHLDLYVTPVGDAIAVGDGKLGAAYLRKFLASPEGKRHPLTKDLTKGMADMSDAVLGTAAGLRGLDRVSELDEAKLNQIADRLAGLGYKVYRLPILTGRLMVTPFLTYNNVVQSGKNVYVPVYGIPEMDRAAQAFYRARGLDPIPVDGAYELVRQGGSLRCAILPIATGR